MLLPTRMQRVLAVDPFDLLDREFVRGVSRQPTYAVDVRENADTLTVEAELPGYKKEQLEIVLDKSTLTITATRPGAAAGKAADKPGETTGDWLLRERRGAAYQRRFNLPATADGAAVDARLEDGVLTVTLTKREETKPRKIAVN